VKEPLVSVIVPTRNSEAFLERCLASIRNQSYANVEVIAVDNYSSDGTAEIARKYADKFYQKGPERSSQVNFGVSKSKGKYVYRVDSDFVVDRDVVKECVEKCEDGWDAVAVHNTSDPSVSFWSKVRKLERDCYRDDDVNVAARFFRKDVFLKAGGFDEELIAAEDYDIHNRIVDGGFKVGRIKSQEIHLGEPKSLGEIVRKHYFYGKSIGNYLRNNPGGRRKQMNPIRGSYFRHWKEFMSHPILTGGFVVYQFSRFGAGGVGLLVGKVRK